jgi:hypothetical protein
LKKAKAASVVLRTENRDKIIVPLTILFPAPPIPECSAVAYIAKDAKISVWSLRGEVAKVFSKGFAGPDMTLGTEGVRAQIARCDSTILFVGADDAMSWGLVYDLATMSRVTPDGGATKVTQIAVVPGTVVPGHKVSLD